jgi:post-segregation antitoxin (ccd killing protein)
MSADMKTLLAEVVRMREEMAGLKAAMESSKTTKAKKEKRATTNVEGPAAWNLFVKETQKTMAAAAGVDVSSMDETAFKKAAAAKDSGFGWQTALKEASRRKAALEGRDPEAPKPAKKTAAKTAAPAVVSAPAAAPAPAKKVVIVDPLAAAKKEFEELNLGEIEINGKSYYINQDCLEVYEIASQWVVGERLGMYDFETESIDVFA